MRISDWSSDVCSSDLVFRNTRVVDLRQFVDRLHGLEEQVVQVAVLGDSARDLTEGGFRFLAHFFPFASSRRGLSPDSSILSSRRSTARSRRSDERGVGKECVGTFRTRGSRYLIKKKK